LSSASQRARPVPSRGPVVRPGNRAPRPPAGASGAWWSSRSGQVAVLRDWPRTGMSARVAASNSVAKAAAIGIWAGPPPAAPASISPAGAGGSRDFSCTAQGRPRVAYGAGTQAWAGAWPIARPCHDGTLPAHAQPLNTTCTIYHFGNQLVLGHLPSYSGLLLRIWPAGHARAAQRPIAHAHAARRSPDSSAA
jgi:hypothetical protein